MHIQVRRSSGIAECDACQQLAVEPGWYWVLSQERVGRNVLQGAHTAHATHILEIPEANGPSVTDLGGAGAD